MTAAVSVLMGLAAGTLAFTLWLIVNWSFETMRMRDDSIDREKD